MGCVGCDALLPDKAKHTVANAPVVPWLAGKVEPVCMESGARIHTRSIRENGVSRDPVAGEDTRGGRGEKKQWMTQVGAASDARIPKRFAHAQSGEQSNNGKDAQEQCRLFSFLLIHHRKPND